MRFFEDFWNIFGILWAKMKNDFQKNPSAQKFQFFFGFFRNFLKSWCFWKIFTNFMFFQGNFLAFYNVFSIKKSILWDFRGIFQSAFYAKKKGIRLECQIRSCVFMVPYFKEQQSHNSLFCSVVRWGLWCDLEEEKKKILCTVYFNFKASSNFNGHTINGLAMAFPECYR